MHDVDNIFFYNILNSLLIVNRVVRNDKLLTVKNPQTVTNKNPRNQSFQRWAEKEHSGLKGISFHI